LIHPYFNIVSCCLGLNDIKGALSQLKQGLEKAGKLERPDGVVQSFEENFTTLFMHASQENIEYYLKEAINKISKFKLADQFNKSISQSIFEILKQHADIELRRFEFIETCLNDMFKENESMIIPLKFLDIGIGHLIKKEKNALLQFTKEERATFKKFVLDQIKGK
jgi:ribosomal protein L18E